MLALHNCRASRIRKIDLEFRYFPESIYANMQGPPGIKVFCRKHIVSVPILIEMGCYEEAQKLL